MRLLTSRFAEPVLMLGAFTGALATAAGVVALAGGEPVAALRAILAGSAGDVQGMVSDALTGRSLAPTPEMLRSLAKATPLLLSGLAVALALRGGLFNIGAEGQLLVGGLAAAYAGYAWSAPGPLHIVLCLAIGATGGALWASIAGALKAWRGAHEVIVTIMLNYIAIELTHSLVAGPLRDPSTMAPGTPTILPTARLWTPSGGTTFSSGFFLAILCIPVVSALLTRTSLGLEIRAVGLNATAASANGVRVPQTILRTMALSGTLAGLAGAVEVLGVHGRYLDAFSPGYGFDSIAVALLGGLNPYGVGLAALMFGALGSGSVHMEAWTDTPRQIAGIVQALVILAAGLRWMSRRSLGKSD